MICLSAISPRPSLSYSYYSSPLLVFILLLLQQLSSLSLFTWTEYLVLKQSVLCPFSKHTALYEHTPPQASSAVVDQCSCFFFFFLFFVFCVSLVQETSPRGPCKAKSPLHCHQLLTQNGSYQLQLMNTMCLWTQAVFVVVHSVNSYKFSQSMRVSDIFIIPWSA